MQAVTVTKRVRSRRRSQKNSTFSNDMLIKLYELLRGERSAMKVFSKVLNEEIEFVSAAGEEADASRPVYTTRELSFILSMSPDELRKYHYFKTRLV